MGAIRSATGGAEERILGRALIGRSAGSDVLLTAPGASNEHAKIQWTGAEWVIRDLRSRNGTWINDQLLLGAELRLVVGDWITFGDPRERWQWVEGTPPVATATLLDGRIVEANGGFLFLPDDEFPLASIYPRRDGWELDIGGETREINDREWITVGEEHYRIHLPVLDPSAHHTQTLVPERRLVDARIRFHVSLDEEHVGIIVESGGLQRNIAPKAFHYMLLVLARARLADLATGIPDTDSGWMYADDLATQLGVDVTTLNVHVHRARHMFAQRKEGAMRSELSFSDASELVQRRSGQLRIGVGDAIIEKSAAVPKITGAEPSP